ncbi:sigma-70 family RNA polymerase sigma factor [Cellulomonas sp. Leaf395]|uniref:sigma-70 family RNA polymerase sigma factor n=1 Tax=Cellulomonas sp. Leaf395 TaxID=1736362 RepID=UPI00138EDB34|nr:sigma-70 family RNA polymerase sigma factor [Cellulomonas sp. Leaf395]
MSASTQLDSGVTGDAELIATARSGDAAAIGALYERHAGAAWVVARQYSDSPTDADDVVADSFAAVFGAIERGKGPESAFRAYLFTVVRRVAGLRREKNRRVRPTDDIAVLEAGTALAGTAEEPALAGFERGVVARAFHSLPERWQAVLWHTEVEGLTPAEIAPILGLTANGVAALAYRAREGLRQAYLQQHLQDPLDEGCRTVAGKLGAYVRGGLGTRETGQVEAHLEDCGTCRGLLLELGDVNHGMRAVIAPLVLGVLGLGALGVALPVGGGLAAGAAAASAAGVAGAGAGGVAVGGTTAAGAAATTGTVTAATTGTVTAATTGTVTAATTGTVAAATTGTAAATTVAAVGAGAAGAAAAVGAGAAGGAAAAGGVAAVLAAIPMGVAAAVAGGVTLAAVATVGITTLLGPPDEATAAAPEPTSSESPSSTAEPSTSAGAVATPQPTDIPTAEPSDLLADDLVVLDEEDAATSADGVDDVTADSPEGTGTTLADPDVLTDPVVPAAPEVPVDPPAPAPVDAVAPVLSLDEGDPHVWLGGGTGTVSFTVRASGADAVGTRATLTLPVNLRANLAAGASPANACTESANRRTVVCDLTTVTAGSTVLVSVSVVSVGNARGTVSVAVEAVGASAQGASEVPTSSAGLDVPDSATHATESRAADRVPVRGRRD